MFDLGKAVGSLAKWEKLRGLIAAAKTPSAGAFTTLEAHTLDTNPGNLRMWTYMPSEMADDRALVVVLHGCGQTAAGYNHGAGLVDPGRALRLCPAAARAAAVEQSQRLLQLVRAGRHPREAAAKPLSIRQMVEKMVRRHGIDPRRVFITGLSAGGAMTSVMLACYPELFAGGAIIAGLPYGAAANVQQAFESMFQSPSRPAREWGDLVRRAAPHHKGRGRACRSGTATRTRR